MTRFLRFVVALLYLTLTVALIAAGAWWLMTAPNSPLPAHWNPLAKLDPTAPPTPVTRIQLRRALGNNDACVEALDKLGVGFTRAEDVTKDEHCGINGRVRLSSLATAKIRPVETRCATALRLAMWEHHVIQPRAQDILGTSAAELRQIGSYNCRRMRTSDGDMSRWSSHATADAIDITGVTLADGRVLKLVEDWGQDDADARFLEAIWRGSCDWFRLVLGPDYNRLHADHFHLQNTGWGFCR